MRSVTILLTSLAYVKWAQAQYGLGEWYGVWFNSYNLYVDARERRGVYIGHHSQHTSRVAIGAGVPVQVGASHFPYDDGNVYIRPRENPKNVIIGDVNTQVVKIGTSAGSVDVVSNTTTVKQLLASGIKATGDVEAVKFRSGDAIMSNGSVCVGGSTCVTAKSICFGGTSNCVAESQGEIQLNAPKTSAKALRADSVTAADKICVGDACLSAGKACVGETCITSGKVCFGKSCLSEDQIATLLMLITERRVQESANKS